MSIVDVLQCKFTRILGIPVTITRVYADIDICTNDDGDELELFNLLKQCAAVTTQDGFMMVAPQVSLVRLKNRADIHGQELGTLSCPPTILRERGLYKPQRFPQSRVTEKSRNVSQGKT